jgi:hypothetical protein
MTSICARTEMPPPGVVSLHRVSGVSCALASGAATASMAPDASPAASERKREDAITGNLVGIGVLHDPSPAPNLARTESGKMAAEGQNRR